MVTRKKKGSKITVKKNSLKREASKYGKISGKRNKKLAMKENSLDFNKFITDVAASIPKSVANHLENSQRELLLAVRSLVDEGINRLESK